MELVDWNCTLTTNQVSELSLVQQLLCRLQSCFFVDLMNQIHTNCRQLIAVSELTLIANCCHSVSKLVTNCQLKLIDNCSQPESNA